MTAGRASCQQATQQRVPPQAAGRAQFNATQPCSSRRGQRPGARHRQRGGCGRRPTGGHSRHASPPCLRRETRGAQREALVSVCRRAGSQVRVAGVLHLHACENAINATLCLPAWQRARCMHTRSTSWHADWCMHLKPEAPVISNRILPAKCSQYKSFFCTSPLPSCRCCRGAQAAAGCGASLQCRPPLP